MDLACHERQRVADNGEREAVSTRERRVEAAKDEQAQINAAWEKEFDEELKTPDRPAWLKDLTPESIEETFHAAINGELDDGED